MPVYTYHCDHCGHEFDKQQSFSEKALVVCPACRKHQLRKVYSPAGVVFKGSGFYVTDKKSGSATAPGKKASSNGSTKKEETKPESKKEKKAEAPKAKAEESKSTK